MSDTAAQAAACAACALQRRRAQDSPAWDYPGRHLCQAHWNAWQRRVDALPGCPSCEQRYRHDTACCRLDVDLPRIAP